MSDMQPLASVHPRVCGERSVNMISSRSVTGSSPRVRGTRTPFDLECIELRFIPACAGNAWSKPVKASSIPVHPRVCGERLIRRCKLPGDFGSSPRVRGTLINAAAPAFKARFIPACAGNANHVCKICFQLTVHPRVCGERIYTVKYYLSDYGSSPRVRGTLCIIRQAKRSKRFIPACAGNAKKGKTLFWVGPVHPRVCGER